MRNTISIHVSDLHTIRCNILQLAKEFNSCIILDSHVEKLPNRLPAQYINYQLLAGLSIYDSVIGNANGSFEKIRIFQQQFNDWYFLHLTFDLMEDTHGIKPKFSSHVVFPSFHIFRPQFVIEVKNDILTVHYLYGDEQIARSLITEIQKPRIKHIKKETINLNKFKTIEKPEYNKQIKILQQHIARGDIYEVNYCINFYYENIKINPYYIYLKLSEQSPAPFSVFYKLNNQYLISASPERFLRKNGNQILSQPIKGTASRGKNRSDDENRKNSLLSNPKEIAENVMITDLVRNDLTRCAQIGSVEVKELCGLYSFKHVHQLISTISCSLSDSYHFVDAIKYAFPMGSMTGAPKYKALQLINETECFARGLFSGSVGYIDPNQNFDLNVVIRSILYNEPTRYVSIPAGSAITAAANADDEYNECCLKSKALIDLLIS